MIAYNYTPESIDGLFATRLIYSLTKRLNARRLFCKVHYVRYQDDLVYLRIKNELTAFLQSPHVSDIMAERVRSMVPDLSPVIVG